MTAALAVAISVELAAGLTALWLRPRRDAGPPLPAAAEATSVQLGIADGFSVMFRTASRVAEDFDRMRDAGARWVRFDLWWGAVEPEPGRFRWAAIEQVVRAARARGIGVVLIPMHPPEWARAVPGNEASPPASADQYARFVAAAARRLRHLGAHAWEIWNEPNTSQAWAPAPDPDGYGRLLHAAAAAVRDADRQAYVLFGGLAPGGDDRADPADFVRRAYAAGAGGSFDAMAVHPYGTKQLDLTDSNRVRAVMAEAGDGQRPLWGTEFGVPTSADRRGVTEEEQARILTVATAEWRQQPWAGPLLVYMLRDAGPDRADPSENFGLLRRDGQPKPAYAAYRQQAVAAAGPG